MTDFGKIHDYIQSKREEIVNELCTLEITVKMLIECDKIKE
jgi:hypothetical protein